MLPGQKREQACFSAPKIDEETPDEEASDESPEKRRNWKEKMFSTSRLGFLARLLGATSPKQKKISG
jgi:hypothetical protein